jgi:hypothetical protein
MSLTSFRGLGDPTEIQFSPNSAILPIRRETHIEIADDLDF